MVAAAAGALQTYRTSQSLGNSQSQQINILRQNFEQDPNTLNYKYGYEQDNGQIVSIVFLLRLS